MNPVHERMRAIRAAATSLGFDRCEAAPVRALDAAPRLREWLALGMHGSMQWMERSADSLESAGERREHGVLLGSGLVGGTGLLGVAISGVAAWTGRAPEGFGIQWAGPAAPLVGFLVFAAMVFWFTRSCRAATSD